MRGTTPTEYVHIPSEKILATDIDEIWFTITQNKRIIIDKTIADATLTNQTFAFPLSQEETLSLDPEEECLAQVRVHLQNGKSWKSQIWAFDPGDILKEGVMVSPSNGEQNEV